MGRAGDGRHCARCATDVVDLTRVTRSQAEAILRAAGGTVCGRVRSDAHGAPVFTPEPVRRGILPVAVAGLLAACAAEPDAAADATDEVAAPVDVGSGLALSATRPRSFGGSIATGVMMPVGPDAPLVVSPASATPVPTIAATEEGDVIPTAEQRAQTRRKRWQRQVHAHPPPPPHHWMGMMVLDD